MYNFAKEIEYLEAFLITEYDTTVIFGKNEKDAFYYDANCIGINTNHTKEIQLFCLLHEAGHLILRTRDDFRVVYSDSSEVARTQANKVDVVREEIDAWTEGRLLAGYLNIHIDESKWNRYWKRQIFKYIKWASEI